MATYEVKLLADLILGAGYYGYIFDTGEKTVNRIIENDNSWGSSKGSIKHLVTTIFLQIFKVHTAYQVTSSAIHLLGLGNALLIKMPLLALSAISVGRAVERMQGRVYANNQSSGLMGFMQHHIFPIADHIGTITHTAIIISTVASAVFAFSISPMMLFFSASLAYGFAERGGYIDDSLATIIDWSRFAAFEFCLIATGQTEYVIAAVGLLILRCHNNNQLVVQ